MLSIEKILDSWPPDLSDRLHYCVGLSGGVDSVVLLHIFAQIRQFKSFKLTAIHVNHGISPNAATWQLFCISLCANLKIPLSIAKLKVARIGGEGLENSARKARYQEYIKTNADVIILAHHQDDQIETFLSQLMRGSNIHNLAAMQAVSKRRQQLMWRPFLAYTKQEITSYAAKNELSHIEDESNHDNTYLRNFLRNKIIPELLNFDQMLIPKLHKTLGTIQEAVQLNDELARLDLKQCMPSAETNISLVELAKLSNLRQINLLNYFIAYHNLPLPSSNQIKEFCRQALTAKPDRHPELKLTPKHSLIRHAQSISIRKN